MFFATPCREFIGRTQYKSFKNNNFQSLCFQFSLYSLKVIIFYDIDSTCSDSAFVPQQIK